MTEIRSLSVVIPALNESGTVEASIEKILAYGRGRFDPLEVIVVDDGSTDGMAESIARRFGASVKVLRHSQRRGKGAAVATGVAAATQPWILFTDADLSIPIEELDGFREPAARAPIVIGSKRAPGSRVEHPPLRRLLGSLANLLVSAVAVRGIRDTQCGFKLFRADVAKPLFRIRRIDGFGFDFEILHLAQRYGLAIEERPVRCERPRRTTVGARSYVAALSELGRLLAHRLLGRYPPPPLS